MNRIPRCLLGFFAVMAGPAMAQDSAFLPQSPQAASATIQVIGAAFGTEDAVAIVVAVTEPSQRPHARPRRPHHHSPGGLLMPMDPAQTTPAQPPQDNPVPADPTTHTHGEPQAQPSEPPLPPVPNAQPEPRAGLAPQSEPTAPPIPQVQPDPQIGQIPQVPPMGAPVGTLPQPPPMEPAAGYCPQGQPAPHLQPVPQTKPPVELHGEPAQPAHGQHHLPPGYSCPYGLGTFIPGGPATGPAEPPTPTVGAINGPLPAPINQPYSPFAADPATTGVAATGAMGPVVAEPSALK